MAEGVEQKLEQLEKLLMQQQMLEVVQQEFEVLNVVVVVAAAQKCQELLNTGMEAGGWRHYS
jgi:5-bromo-4-chloroindolyl phosphate hydrolysis protein